MQHAKRKLAKTAKTLAAALAVMLACLSAAQPAEAWSATKDLISTSTCKQTNGRLVNCKIPTSTISGTTTETAVPLRSSVKVVRSGNCSTQYPLEVSYTFDGEPLVHHLFLKYPETTLRRRDGKSITKISIADASKWTSNLNVPSTCKIHLKFDVNQVDVDSEEDASAVISTIEKRLASAESILDAYLQLSEYHRAFLFMRAVADSFLVELTDPIVQDLREGADEILDALTMLSSSCNDWMTDEDRSNIFRLLMSLPQLGTSDDWQKPDGTPKTLADFMGEHDQEIYRTVEKLAAQADATSVSTYEWFADQAAEGVASLEYELNLAKKQLDPWL